MDANVTPHLMITPDGTILCGAQNHYAKRPPAKRVRIATTKPDRRFQPDEGTFVVASDGTKVGIDVAMCGLHAKGFGHAALTISAEMVHDLRPSPALLLDYAKSVYEKALADEAIRQAESNARWANHRREDWDTSTFTVVEKGPGAWLIEGTSPNRDRPYPMTNVEVSTDGDRQWISTSDYMNSGPGRGNASWLAALMDALQRASLLQQRG